MDYNKFNCISCKIIAIFTILLSIAFTPMQYYYCGLNFHYENLIGLLFISVSFLFIGWMSLLKTNNPITRYNILSLNPKWVSNMEHSMAEDPSQLVKLDSPDENEVKQRNRYKKIEKIINGK